MIKKLSECILKALNTKFTGTCSTILIFLMILSMFMQTLYFPLGRIITALWICSFLVFAVVFSLMTAKIFISEEK